MRGLLLSLFCLLCACTTSPPTQLSAWGEITPLGRAESAEAPALAVQSTGTLDLLYAGWIDADQTRLHFDLRQRTQALWGNAQTAPIPLVRPRSHSAIGVDQRQVHHLWLDEDYRQNRTSGVETRLISALYDESLNVLRGPTLVSDRVTYRYTTVYAGDGALWVVWSGGNPAEPALFAQQIDSTGRPMDVLPLVLDGDFPTLVTASDGTDWLIWGEHDGRVYRARFTDGQITDVSQIGDFVRQAGTQWVSLSAGMSADALHLFWNVVNPAGQAETWWLAYRLDSPVQSPPVPLQMGARREPADFATGYNGGFAYQVEVSSVTTRLSWAQPITLQQRYLPVAVWDGVRLGVAYLDSSGVIAYQPVADVSLLLSAPTFVVDRDLHFSLAWAQPRDDGDVDMQFTSTRSPETP